MANYTITLTVGEDVILQKIAGLRGTTAEAIVESIGTESLKDTALSWLEDATVEKARSLTPTEKIAFLEG